MTNAVRKYQETTFYGLARTVMREKSDEGGVFLVREVSEELRRRYGASRSKASAAIFHWSDPVGFGQRRVRLTYRSSASQPSEDGAAIAPPKKARALFAPGGGERGRAGYIEGLRGGGKETKTYTPVRTDGPLHFERTKHFSTHERRMMILRSVVQRQIDIGRDVSWHRRDMIRWLCVQGVNQSMAYRIIDAMESAGYAKADPRSPVVFNRIITEDGYKAAGLSATAEVEVVQPEHRGSSVPVISAATGVLQSALDDPELSAELRRIVVERLRKEAREILG